ncbi:MAG: bifunctional molybdenum cofactor biosynthesis protein MoaC/MoaB, partial [Candidatus Dadabacteria bacterium]
MRDITPKIPSKREALASGKLFLSQQAFKALKESLLEKGNPFPMAETAAIMAVKSTPLFIPLCHQIPINSVEVLCELDEELRCVKVQCKVLAEAKTGVEMEALTGVLTALLVIYDLVKPVDSSLKISDIKLEYKKGGKKGIWLHPESSYKEELAEEGKNLLSGIKAWVLTVSTSAARGDREDLSGDLIVSYLTNEGASVLGKKIVVDEKERIKESILSFYEKGADLIILTGGTGFSKDDLTPEALKELSIREAPGLGEALRRFSSSPYSYLSRAVSGILKESCIVISLPGNPNSIKEGWQVLRKLLPHALE